MLLNTIFALFIGCGEGDQPSTEPIVSAEDRALLEKLKKQEKEKQEKLNRYNSLIQNPNNFITSGSGLVNTFDKGIINRYTEIKSYPLRNTSEFKVTDIYAEIKVLDSKRQLLGIVPAHFVGSLAPGADKRLLIEKTTTLQGKGETFQLTVSKVVADKPN